MSSDNHMNNSEKEVDEVDAALSDLEITLEGGKTSNTLVRHIYFWRWCVCRARLHPFCFPKCEFLPLVLCFVWDWDEAAFQLQP